MKSNQERSNDCLPPKKRELASSTLLSDDQRPLVMAPSNDGQRSENLAWFASVASGHNSGQDNGGQRACESDGPQYKPLVSTLTDSSSSRVAVSSLSTIYTSPLSQHVIGGAGGAGGGTIHYTQLPPNLQFVASPYAPAGHAPYAGYISSQLLPPPPPPPPFSSAPSSHRLTPHPDSSPYPSSTLSSKMDQNRSSSRVPPMQDAGPQQYVQISGSPLSVAPRTAPSCHGGPLPLPLHPHHTLALSGGSHMLVQYADRPPRKEEGVPRPREMLNGNLEKGGRRFETGLGKPGSKGTSTSTSSSSSSPHFHQHSTHHYEARHVVLPSDFTTQDPSGLQTSLMLVPNSHGAEDHHHHHHHHPHHPAGSPDKLPISSPHQEKGGIVLGKPITRAPSSSSSSFIFPPPLSVENLKPAVGTQSPHTVIQTTHNATEPLSMGLPSTNFYPQPSIIGYISGGGGQQQPIGYHASLAQHLLIPGAQPVIIPVSGGGVASLEAPAHAVTVTSSGFPAHTYVTTVTNPTPKDEHFEAPAPPFAPPAVTGAVIQAQLHLPVVPAPAGVLTTPPSAPPSLPPYFIKGSIIQLADGELKRVEDLKTEDFIQSAEISSELKIDSSTVERIEGSPTPNFAIVQFSVGEHRSQVSVEVLAEYPFFVFGQGWSSCCPDRTTQLLELPCTKLSVGDVCISLTLRNLRNGSLKKTQSLELNTQASAASNPSHVPFG